MPVIFLLIVLLGPANGWAIYGYKIEFPSFNVTGYGSSYKNWIQNKTKPVVDGISARWFPEKKKEVCYDSYGCFSTDYPFYSVLRPFSAPESPEKIGTVFYFSYRLGSKEEIDPRGCPYVPEAYDSSKLTIFIVHGYFHSTRYLFWTRLRDALLAQLDCNVFLVDYSKSSYSYYTTVGSNIRVVAAEMEKLVQFLMESNGLELSNVWCIGHSLGAQACGYFGNRLPGVGRITGLDPASPGFESSEPEVRLDPSDAVFVDVHHTDVSMFGFGTKRLVGHVDFYYNHGDKQPNCDGSDKFMDRSDFLYTGDNMIQQYVRSIQGHITCNHMMSVKFFTEAVGSTNCTMWGKTDTLNDTDDCGLESCSPVGIQTADYPFRGRLVIKTASNNQPPYCINEAETNRLMDHLITNQIETEAFVPVVPTQPTGLTTYQYIIHKFKQYIKPDF